VSLASFKKRLKPGDSLTLLHAPYKHRALGTARKVIQIRSKDFVFEGRSYCDFPRASNFACDGRLVRIAVGNDQSYSSDGLVRNLDSTSAGLRPSQRL